MAVLNQSFESMKVDPATPPRQRKFLTKGLETTTEEEGNEIRDHDSERIIQSPNSCGALDTLGAV